MRTWEQEFVHADEHAPSNMHDTRIVGESEKVQTSGEGCFAAGDADGRASTSKRFHAMASFRGSRREVCDALLVGGALGRSVAIALAVALFVKVA